MTAIYLDIMGIIGTCDPDNEQWEKFMDRWVDGSLSVIITSRAYILKSTVCFIYLMKVYK